MPSSNSSDINLAILSSITPLTLRGINPVLNLQLSHSPTEASPYGLLEGEDCPWQFFNRITKNINPVYRAERRLKRE